MGQDEGMYQQYIPLALHLAEEHFLMHQSKDVQLLIACCIADVLRVYAPEAPYKDADQVNIRIIGTFLIGIISQINLINSINRTILINLILFLLIRYRSKQYFYFL